MNTGGECYSIDRSAKTESHGSWLRLGEWRCSCCLSLAPMDGCGLDVSLASHRR